MSLNILHSYSQCWFSSTLMLALTTSLLIKINGPLFCDCIVHVGSMSTGAVGPRCHMTTGRTIAILAPRPSVLPLHHRPRNHLLTPPPLRRRLLLVQHLGSISTRVCRPSSAATLSFRPSPQRITVRGTLLLMVVVGARSHLLLVVCSDFELLR